VDFRDKVRLLGRLRQIPPYCPAVSDSALKPKMSAGKEKFAVGGMKMRLFKKVCQSYQKK
jgi:hypothetical protein